MNRSVSETWSIRRSLAFLAATFAIVLGSLMPFAAMAASVPGHAIVICSAEGPQTIQSGGATEDNPDTNPMGGAKCAACVMPMPGTLPVPPVPVAAPTVRVTRAVTFVPTAASPPPPARAPPRPHSTAPPQA